MQQGYGFLAQLFFGKILRAGSNTVFWWLQLRLQATQYTAAHISDKPVC